MNCKSLFFLFCSIFSFYSFAQEPVNLQCEHLVNPIGIDASSPRLSWKMSGNEYGTKQSAYQLIIGTDSLDVKRGNGNTLQTDKIYSDKMLVNYVGNQLNPFTKYFWKVQAWDNQDKVYESKVASFETGMIHLKNWKGSWISDHHGIEYKPAPYFRKIVDLKKNIKSARVYIAAAGLYELFINGEKVGNHRLDPTYTRFDRRNLYVTYDVTKQMQAGANAVGVILGNGWYNHQSTAVWFFDKAPWRNRPAFCLDLRIEYEDKSIEVVSSDNTWKTSPSPIILNSIFTAEHYDARLEQPDWNKPEFDDASWGEVNVRPAPSQHIVAQQLHPIRNVEKIQAKSLRKIDDKTYIYDLGRNISGVSCINVSGEEGTTIRIKHAERLKPDGLPDLSNIDIHYRPKDDSDPFQTDIFILSGKGKEKFMPKFNYKGFQYVEVSSDRPIDLNKESLHGYFMHSDVPQVGFIESSNELLNNIWKATNNAYLSNLFGYPTDCPQREKNGWTGDGHLAIETGLYNFDAITIYEKWLADHQDEQQPNGALPAIIPTSGWGYHWANGVDWTSTIAIIPWEIYRFYGDSKLLYNCYDNMKRYVDYITEQHSVGYLSSWGLGDWVPVKTTSDLELMVSLYYYKDASILAKAAKLFGYTDDFSRYNQLAENIKNAINNKFLNTQTGIYADGTQTELSMPLMWKIVPEDMIEKVASNLNQKVVDNNFHLDVGVHGAKALLNALSENGYAETAYKVATQNTYPSWGWWIVNGASTLYENWNIDADIDISLNHIMFGEIGAWIYKGLGGIFPDEDYPGFKVFNLKPNFIEELKSFSASFSSPHGEIKSSWEIKKGNVTYSVNIPGNTTANFSIPKGYKLDKAELSGRNQKLDLYSDDNGAYKLLPGNYKLIIKADIKP